MAKTRGEVGFIGCGATADFIFQTIESAADRGYGVIVEPVGGENNRAFNLYQITPSKAKAAPDLYEALKELMEALEEVGSNSNGVRTAYDRAKPALSKAENK